MEGAPSPFELRVFTLDPGCSRPYRDEDWRDSLVIVEQGQLELECLHGACRTFRCGDVLWLIGLGLRMLRNPGPETTRLAAFSRPTDEFRQAPSS